MKVALFYPPVGNMCQPYLSTPTLVAFLKQHGVYEVFQYDYNIDVMEELLSTNRLRRAYRWCYHRLHEYARIESLSDVQAMRWQLSLGAVMDGPKTIHRIDWAKQVFRTDGFYDAVQYRRALDTIRTGFQLISARYFPTVLNHQSLRMGYRLDISEQILNAVEDEQTNCFIEILSNKVQETFTADGIPDVAGISIGYFEQLIPGLTLAQLIKKYSPKTHVTIGGTLMNALFRKKFNPRFFRWFDSIIFFEAEIAFLNLIHALKYKTGFDHLSNIAFLKNGEVIRKAVSPERIELKSLTTPDFSGLPLRKYLSPEPIIPIAGSRGCYWRKCSFCTRQHYIDTFRQRPVQQIIQDMTILQDRYGARTFFFVDECVSPSVLNALSEAIIEKRLDVRWSCYVRFEAKLADKTFCNKLARSGLHMLYFGLESASQRVIDLMRKGNRKETIAKILEATASSGILNMILYFVGFPTETREEALETYTFLMEHRDFVTFALAGQFLLEENTPIFSAPEKFGITQVAPLDKNSDFGIVYDYKTDSGLSAEEAEKLKDWINLKSQVLHQRDFLNRSHLLLSS